MSNSSHTPDRLLNIKDVIRKTSLSRPSVYRAIKKDLSEGGGFPNPIHLGNRSAWSERAIDDWIEQQKQINSASNQ